MFRSAPWPLAYLSHRSALSEHEPISQICVVISILQDCECLYLCSAYSWFLASAGASLIVVGCADAADYGLDSPSAWIPVVAGIFALLVTVRHILTTKKHAVIPPVSAYGLY